MSDAVIDFPVATIREQFPVLKQTVHGKPLVYLDSAASCQKPQQVINAISRLYEKNYSNVHRGVHTLSQSATADYEQARVKTQKFINAASTKEIIFVRGTTEGINLVASSFGEMLSSGDEIIISEMEHHSNIVPWQLLANRKGIKLKVIPINELGELDLERYQELLSAKTKLVAVSHMSNALGTINPVQEIIAMAHRHNVPVLVDGAQGIPHLTVDVQALNCDFYAFSAHKAYGPSGIGALYGKQEWLEKMPPYQGGGDMISYVTFEQTTYNELPYKFEAGTPNIAGAIGMGAAFDFMQSLDRQAMLEHENALLEYATKQLKTIPNLRIIGEAKHKGAVVSFLFDDIHAHDLGTILDQSGIAIRAGHHCAMPVMDKFGVPSTVRASFACYNTFAEIDTLVTALAEAREIFV